MFSMEMKHSICSQMCFKLSNFFRSHINRTFPENIFITGNNSHDRHFFRREVLKQRPSQKNVPSAPRQSRWCGGAMRHLTCGVTTWTRSMFLAWSEGYVHPSAACSPGTLKSVSHVWSVKIRGCHHMLSPPYFFHHFISVPAAVSSCTPAAHSKLTHS